MSKLKQKNISKATKKTLYETESISDLLTSALNGLYNYYIKICLMKNFRNNYLILLFIFKKDDSS